MQVELYKKIVPYVDNKGEERTATNFFAKCGDVLVPIEVNTSRTKKRVKIKIIVLVKRCLQRSRKKFPNATMRTVENQSLIKTANNSFCEVTKECLCN